MTRRSKDATPPRRHARRGAKKAGHLRSQELDHLLALAALGKKPPEIRAALARTWNLNVNVKTIAYHIEWGEQKIAALRQRIASEGEIAVLASLESPPALAGRDDIDPDAPVWIRYADQLPPDYHPRPDDLPPSEPETDASNAEGGPAPELDAGLDDL